MNRIHFIEFDSGLVRKEFQKAQSLLQIIQHFLLQIEAKESLKHNKIF